MTAITPAALLERIDDMLADARGVRGSMRDPMDEAIPRRRADLANRRTALSDTERRLRSARSRLVDQMDRLAETEALAAKWRQVEQEIRGRLAARRAEVGEAKLEALARGGRSDAIVADLEKALQDLGAGWSRAPGLGVVLGLAEALYEVAPTVFGEPLHVLVPPSEVFGRYVVGETFDPDGGGPLRGVTQTEEHQAGRLELSRRAVEQEQRQAAEILDELTALVLSEEASEVA